MIRLVEGDILTADLRERLQRTYGGGGTGFAPMASPLTAFRRSVKTQSKGWTSYNIMQRRNAPEALRNNFFVSGWACQATAGASTSWSRPISASGSAIAMRRGYSLSVRPTAALR